jgi:valyl-tRNA synthetase
MNFSRPGESLRDFTWNELADWYLEIAKIEGNKAEILLFLLENILKLWHPFMPFVTEEIYRLAFAMGEQDFLMVGEWPKAAGKADKKAEKEFGLVRDLVGAVRNIRATYKVEPGKRIDVTMFCGAKKSAVSAQAPFISGLAKIGRLDIAAKGAKPEKSASQVVGGVQIFIPLGSLVDFAAEKQRLTEELAQAEKYLTSLEGKLANESFVARAPAAVVAAEREKMAVQKDKIAKLREQMGQLG